MDINNNKQLNNVDIKENYIYNLDSELLSLLLCDKTTKTNLIWATDNYKSRGYGYGESDHITILAVSGKHGSVIKPRIEKSKEEIKKRTKDKAEVFTPSWVCNCQNNLVDEAWFGRKSVFNIEKDKCWITVNDIITFPENKTWQDYVKENRLEITCGEAPYIVSRYDTVTGEIIEIENRIGLLDRKLRVVNENTQTEEDWLYWARWAIKSVYAYDWQGDNVLLARENLLFTFVDYYKNRFNKFPSVELMKGFAEIIVWNVWQMDGLKCVIPNSCHNEDEIIPTLLGEIRRTELCVGCEKNNINKHNGIYCKIMDWEKEKEIKFVSLIKR